MNMFRWWISVAAAAAAVRGGAATASVHEGVSTTMDDGRVVVKDLFHRWMQEFGVQYTNAIEWTQRLEIWTENHCTYAQVFICVVICVFGVWACCCCTHTTWYLTLIVVQHHSFSPFLNTINIILQLTTWYQLPTPHDSILHSTFYILD